MGKTKQIRQIYKKGDEDGPKPKAEMMKGYLIIFFLLLFENSKIVPRIQINRGGCVCVNVSGCERDRLCDGGLFTSASEIE